MAIIKKRRLSAYRFLKYYRLKVTGRGKVLMLDISAIPNDVTIEEFLAKWKSSDYQNRNNIQWIDSK